jgi:hypothetical protein
MPVNDPPTATDADMGVAALASLSTDGTIAREFVESKNENGATVAAEDRFKVLATMWKAETRFLSNVTTKSMHIAYQRIIGMGPNAVPLILRDLIENGPNDWFWALSVITDANPITNDIAGNMQAMTEAWISWGKTAGYLKDFPNKTSSASQIS